MQRIIREEEPPRPSTRLSTMGEKLTVISKHRSTDPKRLTQLVRGDLDWIVMKALEKERGRRYESASSFAADITRHLHDEVIQARPPSARYKLRKFIRRNKGSVAAALAVILSLIVGITGLTYGLVLARLAESDARNEAAGLRKLQQLYTDRLAELQRQAEIADPARHDVKTERERAEAQQ